jgi:hypothetical protein
LEKAVQSKADQGPGAHHDFRQKSTEAPTEHLSGNLAQLAAMMNSSPRMEALAQMKEDIQRRAHVQNLQQLSTAQLSESPRSPLAPGETAQLKIGIAGTLAHGDRAGQDSAMEDHGASAAESPSSACGCNSKLGAAETKREKSPAQKKSNRRFAADATVPGHLPLQAKFGGSLGKLMIALTPLRARATGTYYETLYIELEKSDKVVAVEPGLYNYIPSKSQLTLHGDTLGKLVDGETEFAPEERAEAIAKITHELSHAHDHLIVGRELTGDGKTAEHTSKVLDTELRAWAREALTAYQLNSNQAKTNTNTADLINGWLGFKVAMLDDIKTYKDAKNELMRRIWDYVDRELAHSEDANIQEFATAKKDWLADRISVLRTAIVKKMPKHVHLL